MAKMKMVTHAKLQYYKHNYCLVCMTGLLGCRWHRYKQSTHDSRKVITQYYKHNYCLVCMAGLLGCRWHRYKQSTHDSRKRDLFVFMLMLLTFLFSACLLYSIIIAENDFDDLNWFFYTVTGHWTRVYTIFLALICIVFIYLTFLMVLYLCHILHGHQLYTHIVHVVVMLVFLSFLIALVVTVQEIWHTEWSVIWLSLKITGPFLQIGAVCVMTALSWVIARQWYTISDSFLQLKWMLSFIIILVGLYISPLFINSPCVILISDLPPRPKIIGQRGASGIAPENTLASFQVAVDYDVFAIEFDVKISNDGVPFLMHDNTFVRTTNIDEVFPSMAKYHVSSFNISQVKQLNAGNWYLQQDPMGSVRSLSEQSKRLYRNQSVPTLLEVLSLANHTGSYVMFNIDSPDDWHPYYNKSHDLVKEVIELGGINPKQILWLTDPFNNEDYQNYTIAVQQYYPSELLLRNNVSYVNLQYSDISESNVRDYQKANISTIIYTVNTKWFYSYYWCLGVDAVSTNNCHILNAMEAPVWHLFNTNLQSPRNYLILWITVDVMSFLIVITAFIVQRIWWTGSSYNPEKLSISSNEHGTRTRISMSRSGTHRNSKRQMKQKLIMRDVGDIYSQDDGIEEDYGIESNYTIQSADGRELVQSFRSQSRYQDGTSLELNKVTM
ncbi:hypothetical protein FSP39_009932 [Pinctada imbricata]|uniref:GP-PDE domain-containing protein n=1 Tax=Pinctada imbricata TaxID=66713 RepID=A0AA88XZV9_PINIB|nr:hypothetical protein FSP39_009932 [Pinctada imbricata]